MSKVLFEHQRKLIDAFPRKHVLVWGTGTGKTRTSIELAKKAVAPFIVICPKALKGNWKNEIKKWGGQEALVLSKEEFRRDFEKIGYYKCIIVDEAHHFFGMNSAMSRTLLKYIKTHNPPHLYLLTATPYRSSPWDIYRMCEIMGRKMNYLSFRREFFVEVRMGYRMVPIARNDIDWKLSELVRMVGSTVSLEDCVDVPEQVFETRYFELTKNQEVAINMLTDIQPVVRFTKEHQIAGGTLKGDGYTEDHVIVSDKMHHMLDMVETSNRMIVVCRYNNEINVLTEQIQRRYPGIHVAKITGEVSGEERHATIEYLKHASNYVLLVNAACSEGWELPDCPLMVFYSYDFALKNYIQLLGRIQRIHNIKKNTYLSLVVKGTIDERIFTTITVKKMDVHLEIYAK